ncbi:hypothetical protein ACWPKS_13850 [Coraliomargarita sp. W4R72]
MKKLFTSLITASVCSLSLNAASITFSNFNSSITEALPVIDDSGAFIADGGGYAAVGTFSLSDVAIGAANSSASAFQLLKDDFQIFADSTSFGGAAAFNVDGLFKSELAENIDAGNGLIGDTVFAIIGNGSSLSSSTLLSVFKSGITFAQDDPLFTFEFDISDGASSLLLGEFGAEVDIGAGNSTTLQLVGVVPEPSTYAALAGCFALAWVMVRRRV